MGSTTTEPQDSHQHVANFSFFVAVCFTINYIVVLGAPVGVSVCKLALPFPVVSLGVLGMWFPRRPVRLRQIRDGRGPDFGNFLCVHVQRIERLSPRDAGAAGSVGKGV
jgi:hypothetical protein